MTNQVGYPTCAAQEFVAIILMVSFLLPQHVVKVTGREFLEVFAGRARTSRLASWCGYKTTAVDLHYSRVFNVLKPAGFMFLSLYVSYGWGPKRVCSVISPLCHAN